MAVLKMNVPCLHAKRKRNNLYGEVQTSKPVHTVCAVINLTVLRQGTTVRADSSGTRGHAAEEAASVKILMLKTSGVVLEDILTIMGIRMRVSGVRHRFDVMGRLDHFEVDAEIE